MTGRQWLVWGTRLALVFAFLECIPLQDVRAGGPPNPIYVDVEAKGANDGESWVDALIDLQTALDWALDGWEIRVAAGTYTPGIDRISTFPLKSGVTLYGSFPSGGGDLSDRDLGDHPTILSGEIKDLGIADDCYHVVTGSGTDATAVLDGFIIRGGNADGSVFPLNSGGGMFNDSGSPTLSWVVIEHNYGRAGGGMYNHLGAPTLDGVDFFFNEADYGGAVYNDDSDPSFEGGYIEVNDATYGGGMYNHMSDPDLESVLFRWNDATYGGGMDNYYSSPTMDRVRFEHNEATENGGGMYNDNSDPILISSSFEENSAKFGGGICNISSDPDISWAGFYRNLATVCGGGVYNLDSSPDLINVHFGGNDADVGGGIYSQGTNSYPRIANAVLAGNTARLGAAVDTQGGGYTFLGNVTITSNYASLGGGGIRVSTGTQLGVANSIVYANVPNQVAACAVCPASIENSLVQTGCPPNVTCVGNLVTLNPRFLFIPYTGGDGMWGTSDDYYGDLRLRLNSPAIDAGDNGDLPDDWLDLDDDSNIAEKLPFDIRNAPRRHDVLFTEDTGFVTAPVVDMGAYEVWTTSAHLPLIMRNH